MIEDHYDDSQASYDSSLEVDEEFIVIRKYYNGRMNLAIRLDRNKLIDWVSQLEKHEELWTGRKYKSTRTPPATVTVFSEPDCDGVVAVTRHLSGSEDDRTQLKHTSTLSNPDLYERVF